MARQVFKVDAYIIDANGTYAMLSGYPKIFDSRNYGDNIEKAQRRAEGDMCETWGAMCKNDTRMIQTVTLSTINGYQIEQKTMGIFPNDEPEQGGEE